VIAEQMADLAVSSRGQAPHPKVSQAACRVVVDWFAAVIAACRMAPPTILRLTLVPGGAGSQDAPCRLIPGGERVTLRTAALINGTAAHTAELDDIYRDGIYHPGAPTVAAALALAETLGSSGAELLRAVIVGYEVGDRIAASIQPGHYRFWHTTGTVGTLGAAAACAELLGLDTGPFAHALATATTLASGLRQAFRGDSMSKPLHAGHAAESGALAALAASRGFTGALDLLEGEGGFGAAMSGSVDWDHALAAAGSDWCIMRTTIKNHSCCGHTFAAIDAAMAIRARGLDPELVKDIRVETYSVAVEVAGNTDPQTPFEAKFSISYCVAAALVFGAVRLRAFSDEALHDERVRDLLGKISVSATAHYDTAFPGRRAARVTITDINGTAYDHESLTRRGDPDDPLSDDEISAKFDDLVSPVLGRQESLALERQLWSLSSLADIRTLTLEAMA
jgi:2-methylcitrate dehydratase PrpD